MEYKEPKDCSDSELITLLTKNYEPSKIPPCRVCGEPLTPQRMGGGEPTVWGCGGLEDDPKKPGYVRYKKDRSCADEHYSKSTFTDQRQGGDSFVMELVRRFLDACEV